MRENGYQKVVVNFLGNNIKKTNMEFKMKGSTFYGKGNQSPTKHYVDDTPDHNDGHSDDLQTPEEHKHGKVATDTHWPDGTKKSKRDKFSDAETKAEILKEEKDPNKN